MKRRAYRAPLPGYGSAAVVIPALNEEATVGDVILGARKLLSDVVVVDDHSSDRTAAVAEKSGARVVQNPLGKGVGLATLQGVGASKKPIVVTMDADGQHLPGEIPKLLGPILDGSADFVVGRRTRLPPSEEPVRRAAEKVLRRPMDVGTGFRAFRKRFLRGMRPGDVGLCPCGSLVLFAAAQGARVTEVPVRVLGRSRGRSKYADVSKAELHRKQAEFLLSRYLTERDEGAPRGT